MQRLDSPAAKPENAGWSGNKAVPSNAGFAEAAFEVAKAFNDRPSKNSRKK